MRSFAKIKISLSTPICLAAFTVIYGTRYIFSILAAVILHELGHIAAIYLLNGEISEITLRPFGAVIKKSESNTSYFADFITALAGPLVNIISFLVCLSIGVMGTFAYSSIILALVNLIPAKPLDGYCATRSVSLCFFSLTVSENICRIISVITLTLIWIFTVYMIIFTEFNLSLLIMTTFLICETVISRK